jgi:hypothetical protein
MIVSVQTKDSDLKIPCAGYTLIRANKKRELAMIDSTGIRKSSSARSAIRLC